MKCPAHIYHLIPPEEIQLHIFSARKGTLRFRRCRRENTSLLLAYLTAYLTVFMRFLAICGCAILLSACSGTSYKIAPSTEKVATKLATAKRTVQHARERTTELEKRTTETRVHASSTTEHINAALAAIEKHEYTEAALHLIAAKASNALVESMLKQAQDDVTSVKGSLATTEGDLVEAELEVVKVKKEMAAVVLQAAKDRAIADEVNWGFRIGALFYFVKGILKLGFIGIIILVVVGGGLAIAAMIFGGPFAGFVWRLFRGIWALLRNRKPG